MARRRRIGNALAQTSAQMSQFLEILLRQQKEKERMEMADRLSRERFAYEMGEREKAAAAEREHGMAVSLTQNPGSAKNLVRGGMTKVGGLDLTKMVPTDAEIAGPLFEEIGKATVPGQEPTGTEILGRFRGAGGSEDPHFAGPFPTVMGKEQVGLPTPDVRSPIADLMRARQATESRNLARVHGEAARGPRMGPDGVQITGPDHAPIPLERTGEQEGARQQATLLGGQYSKPVVDAKVNEARRESQARAVGTAAGGGGGTGRLSAVIQERVAAADSALDGIRRIREIFPKVRNKVGPIAGRWESFKTKAPGFEADPDWAQFEAEVIGVKNTIIKFYTGAQMSEPEAQRLAAQVMDIVNKPEVFDVKMRVLEANMSEMKRRMIATALGQTREQLGAFNFAPEPMRSPRGPQRPPNAPIIDYVPRGGR